MTDKTSYTLSRRYEGGIERIITVDGGATLDEIQDALQSPLVMVTPHPHISDRISIIQEEAPVIPPPGVLDLNWLRDTYAQYLHDNSGERHSMDGALMHVCRIAYEKGLSDALVA